MACGYLENEPRCTNCCCWGAVVFHAQCRNELHIFAAKMTRKLYDVDRSKSKALSKYYKHAVEKIYVE